MNKTRRFISLGAAGCASLAAAPLLFAQELAQSAVFTALQRGGLIVLIRHTSAPGTFDPAGFKLDECSTQRNLSEQGKQQAIAMGETLKTNSVPIESIFSSQWCRCLDTARLAFPNSAVEPTSFLNSPTGTTPELRQTRIEQWHKHIQQFGSQKARPKNRIYVSHNFNIQDLTGEAVAEGQALVFDPKSNFGLRPVKVLGRIQF
jgi:phosphohistidine phosphatase SixA